jgi:hypothetical protein
VEHLPNGTETGPGFSQKQETHFAKFCVLWYSHCKGTKHLFIEAQDVATHNLSPHICFLPTSVSTIPTLPFIFFDLLSSLSRISQISHHEFPQRRVSFETSFDSKQPKLEPKLFFFSALSEKNVCLGFFGSIPKQRVSVF